MFKLSSQQIDEISYFAYISDKEIRSDLCRNYITSENDYTSNFTGALRRNINSHTKTGLQATSYLLEPRLERQIGCDAAIIICSKGESKIAVFEAKWPRLATKNYQWDHAQTSTGLSHFSDQLERQKQHKCILAVFEMFYCEFTPNTQPKYMQNEVSSCIWHDDAISFKNSRGIPDSIWDQQDLVSMLQSVNLNVEDILKQVCLCQAGTPISMSDPKDIAREFSLPANVLFIQADEIDQDGENSN
ncbi:hypothetical protein [Methylomonas rhizoryzae]|uniref:hypothetical protein n=1 Tax=Methylomonas rhizoryzae TaxID=2608981 RepID=UPI001232A7D0|nr:hypothetical protein [Methylomonas rhizoryzae]